MKFPPDLPDQVRQLGRLGWVGLGIVLTIFVVARRPDKLADMERVYVEDETVGAGRWQQHRLPRDQVIWSFGPDLQPVLEVEPGDVVTFETNDCFTGPDPQRGRPRHRDRPLADQQRDRPGRRARRRAGRLARRGDPRRAPDRVGRRDAHPRLRPADRAGAVAADPALRGARRDGEDERPRLASRRCRWSASSASRPTARSSRTASPAGTAATSTTTGTARARRSSSPSASPAACSRSATCTRRWATARSASRASRSRARSTSASTSSRASRRPGR